MIAASLSHSSAIKSHAAIAGASARASAFRLCVSVRAEGPLSVDGAQKLIERLGETAGLQTFRLRPLATLASLWLAACALLCEVLVRGCQWSPAGKSWTVMRASSYGITASGYTARPSLHRMGDQRSQSDGIYAVGAIALV
jgi:hypothetical protein